MPKKRPEPYWRKQTKCFHIQLGKKQYRLDPDEKTAWQLYYELMANPPKDPDDITAGEKAVVVEVLDRFLAWVDKHQSPKTHRWYLDHIQNFVSGIPKGLLVSELKPYHVIRVMDSHDTWSASTKNGFARSIQRGFNWAVGQGLIERTPIPKVEKPTAEAREVVVTTPEFQDLLGRFPDQEFRDLLITVWETGCRPNELFRVEARHVDETNKLWTFLVKESKGKKKNRVVHLSDVAWEITKRLKEAYPNGPLFRNADGTQWEKDTVNRRFLRKKKALGRKLCLYHLRHSFCQRLLLEGTDVLTVSLLMGHSSPTMVMKHYQHLQKNPEFLRKALNKSG